MGIDFRWYRYNEGMLALLWIALAAQEFTDLQVERVGAGFRFTEGPAWSPDGFLVFSDVPNNKIHRWEAGRGVDVLRQASLGANGNAFDAKGNLYTCESRSRRVTRTDPKGKVTVLAERYQGKRFNAPNDLCVRKDGHVWFTDPAFGDQSDTRELDFYGVYHLTPNGEITLVAQPKGRPNGIALAPNGRILYVANSDDRNVRAYDVDRDGKAANERVVVADIEGVPDGMRVDEKGNLYVAAKHVYVFTPEGKPLATIHVPETPANVAFGERDYKSLFITARTGVYRVRVPIAGVQP